jgi:hypothetical protein
MDAMSEHRHLLDAFADARRTWDDLVTMQPDIMVASGTLDAADVAEFARRVNSHRSAIDFLADALDSTPVNGPVDAAAKPSSR